MARSISITIAGGSSTEDSPERMHVLTELARLFLHTGDVKCATITVPARQITATLTVSDGEAKTS